MRNRLFAGSLALAMIREASNFRRVAAASMAWICSLWRPENSWTGAGENMTCAVLTCPCFVVKLGLGRSVPAGDLLWICIAKVVPREGLPPSNFPQLETHFSLYFQ